MSRVDVVVSGKIIVAGSTLADVSAMRSVGLVPDGAAIVPSSVVPPVVSLWQARAALQQAGLLVTADAAIAASGNAAAIAAWEYGTEVRRDSPLVVAMSAALNLTATQVDALFVAASKLTV